LFIILFAASSCFADEGMWPLYDLDKLPFDNLQNHGLTLQPGYIFNPGAGGLSDAAVNLSGGSASFVSPKGLIITNHHVAAGAIQRQSDVSNNYLRDGYYAATQEEEIPAIGYTVSITLAVEDVTDRVMSALDGDLSDRERYDAIDKATKEIISETEKDRDVKCRVASMFGGKQYMLYTFFRIRDVRIVYAPPEAIGSYGGDIDNWMWPRHVGDFAFLRAYVAPDGSSAAYSEDNIRYQPKRYFPISSQGVKEGDFTMMIGFPGRTHRYASSYEIDNLLNHYYPMSLNTYEERLAILEEAADSDSALAIRLASRLSGLNNYMKKTYGLYEGFKRSDILNKRLEQEKQLRTFIDNNPEMSEKYGHVLDELDSLYAEKIKNQKRDHILGYITYACDNLSMAEDIYRWASEREKDDIDRDRGYQDRDSVRTKRWLKNKQINLTPSVDKIGLSYFIKRAINLPEDQRIETIDKIFAGIDKSEIDAYLEEYIEKLYANSQIGDLEQRMKMFHMSKDELEKLDDSFINLAMEFTPELEANRERRKQISGANSRLYPKLMRAYADWKEGDLYPDANSTKRFNWGVVKGYSPRDAVSYNYLTGLKGIMEKETGEDPFIVPEALKGAYSQGDFGGYIDPALNDVPINFITTNSGTNGNSGSPILNGKGELIGLDFDTGYEGVSADYMYNPDVCRAIVCDIRYVLFLLDKVYHLETLLEELTIH
jgi:hypothetical protein